MMFSIENLITDLWRKRTYGRNETKAIKLDFRLGRSLAKKVKGTSQA